MENQSCKIIYVLSPLNSSILAYINTKLDMYAMQYVLDL